ncbi:tetratricopeptide repeat protein 21B [Paramisgurnus dabryanus]|uniref:tetratricopeptide repeat protein 21B n=1 Tax=Paramisgurnus dabryanus TaxID=90735 RepID=UPI0031F3D111
MAENDATCLPLIIYHMREKYFRHAINTAVKYLQLYNNDPVLLFFKAFGSLMEGHTQEAMRELYQLKDQRHLSLCSTIALINAHRHCETIDEEAVNELNSDLKLSGSTAGDRALYYAALLYWILDRNGKARTCINKMLKLSDTSPQGLILKGWIMLTSEVEENKLQAIRYFKDSGNVFGLMGQVEFHMAKQNKECALDVVNQMIASHPDFIPALSLKMKILMSLRDWEQTQEVAHRILDRDEHNLKALQMMAVSAAAKDGDMRRVRDHLQCLINAVEMSELNNSRLYVEMTAPISRLVRDRVEFNLLKARALLRSGDMKSVIQCLNTTINMPGVRGSTDELRSSVSVSERVSVYLELTEALRLNGEQHEATKVLQEAIVQFKGTAEESVITLANVDLALARDDVDAAVVLLKKIQPHESAYIQAREKMAHIYLKKNNNKMLYIACYREMTEQLPGVHTLFLLAEAFMKIHQPDEAVKIYQATERTAHKDITLAKRIGHALVKAHEYDKAVSVYESALDVDTRDCLLSLEFADLLFKLQEFEKAQRVLQKTLDHEHSSSLMILMNDVKILRMLVKVLRAMDESTLDAVQKAHDVQQKIIKWITAEQPDQLEDQMKMMANICCDWAHEFHLKHDLEMARHHYTDALNYSPDKEEIILYLARLYYEHQKLDHCEEMCLQILQLHQHHTDAAMLLADTLFWKNQKDEALKMYTDIMERYPDNFHVMVKFLDVQRRLGNLDAMQSVFKSCENFCPLSVREAGYHYCKGLHFWCLYRVTEALNHLNKARGDSQWGERAVQLMVQISLNPDKEVFGGEVLDKRQTNVSEFENQIGIDTAQNLLMKFHPRSKSEEEKVRLLDNLCLIYSKDAKQVEKATLDLTDMLSRNVMLEASLLVAAQGLLQLKQIPRARNLLKRLINMDWNDVNADYLENASLLMADMYIKMRKYSHVDKLLDNCIRHNKSCSKAYEYQGFIMENEQRYEEASLQYELAWKYTNRVDPAVGFRLAFNCLKCKNYTRAVDICHQVLQCYPNYPQIQEEVLIRAQISLRP